MTDTERTTRVRECSWCGTRLSDSGCPRGRGCAQEEANHIWLMETIADQDPKWRVKR